MESFWTSLSWMAWTWQTASFFVFIVAAIITMIIWENVRPGGAPRKGILGLSTTRGDRLFISLLGSAFIHLIWLFALGSPLIGANILAAIYFVVVFRWV